MSTDVRRIHVFAGDRLASWDRAASGAGLRAVQVIEALRAGGHEVTVSVPAGADTDASMTHDAGTYLDLLRRLRPEVAVWLSPLLRTTPFDPGMVHVCDLNGPVPPDGSARDRLVRHCVRADLVLTGSAELNGFWLAELARHGGAATAVVPYATPDPLRVPGLPGLAALRRLHHVGALHAGTAGMALLAQAAAWCGRQGGAGLHIALPAHAPAHAVETTGLGTLQELRRLEAMPGVHLVRAPPLRTLLEGYGPGSVLLDLGCDEAGPQLAPSAELIDALGHGVPLLTDGRSTLARRLVRANAAASVPDGGLDQALDSLAALTPAALGTMSATALDCADRWFGTADTRDALLDGLERACHARRAARPLSRPATADLPQVLVLTEQHSNMRGVRVDVPLGGLLTEGRIAGYAMWGKGRLGFSTRTGEADPAFDAIWVQRDLPPDMALALGSLGLPYLLDIDDNLLVSPAYRAPFSPEQLQATRSLVRGCTAMTTSNDRLAGLLQGYAHTTLIDRTVTCRNLATEQAPWVAPGEPTCIVWASSDKPALTGAYLGIVRAIRDFCLAHGLKLVCIGAPPPDLVLEAGVATEHLGMMAYAAYLDRLRGLAPAILVAPLDTGADPVTQDFIDGKSDIKVLEAMTTGLVGVFSDARAYRDTGLPVPILCQNDHAGWLAGLDQARRLCLHGTPRTPIPDDRMASGVGLQAWADALGRVRLRHPVRLSHLQHALSLTRSNLVRRLLPPGEFDADWYVATNRDVGEAVAAGQITAYEHYAGFGFIEKRPGHPEDSARPEADEFWTVVLNTLSDVRQSLDERAAKIDAIKSRRRRRSRPA